MGGDITDAAVAALLYEILPYDQHAVLRAQRLLDTQIKQLDDRLRQLEAKEE